MRIAQVPVAILLAAATSLAHPAFDSTVEVEQFEINSLLFGGAQLASGDFDSDGIDDLVVFDLFETFIAFGSPAGTFDRRTSLDAPFYWDGYFVIVRDVDLDSDLDIMVSNLGPDFGVPSFFINDGGGQLQLIDPPAFIGVGNARLFDFNLDGFDDVVGIDYFGAVQIMLATGPLTFEKFPTLLEGYTVMPDVGYVNEDKYPDILCGDKLLLMGANLAPQTIVPLPFASDAIIDINGDSIAEVISLLPDSAYVRPATLRTFKIHEGEANLIQSLVVPVTANARVHADDIDGDGDLDLLLSSAPRWLDGTGSFTTPLPCDVTILFNNGDSTFSLGPTLATQGLYTTSVAIGQFDGRNGKDIAMSNNGIGLSATGSTDIRTFGNTLRVMLASEQHRFTSPAQLIAKSLTPSPILDPVCVDLNADGKLDFAAISTNTLHVRMGLGDGLSATRPSTSKRPPSAPSRAWASKTSTATRSTTSSASSPTTQSAAKLSSSPSRRRARPDSTTRASAHARSTCPTTFLSRVPCVPSSSIWTPTLMRTTPPTPPTPLPPRLPRCASGSTTPGPSVHRSPPRSPAGSRRWLPWTSTTTTPPISSCTRGSAR